MLNTPPVQAWDFLYQVVDVGEGGKKALQMLERTEVCAIDGGSESDAAHGISLAQMVTPAVMSRGRETAARACEKNQTVYRGRISELD